MTFQPDIRHRRYTGIDLPDSGNKAVFLVTIWSSERGEVFGRSTKDGVVLTRAGEVVEAQWRIVFGRWPSVSADSHAVLQDCLRGIVAIAPSGEYGGSGLAADRFSKPISVFLPDIIRTFKAVSTRVVAGLPGFGRKPLWEHDYFEHLIQDDRELAEIRLSMGRAPQLLRAPAPPAGTPVKTVDRHPEL